MAKEYIFAYKLRPETPTRRFWTSRKADAVAAAKELQKEFVDARVAVADFSSVAYEFPTGAANLLL